MSTVFKYNNVHTYSDVIVAYLQKLTEHGRNKNKKVLYYNAPYTDCVRKWILSSCLSFLLFVSSPIAFPSTAFTPFTQTFTLYQSHLISFRSITPLSSLFFFHLRTITLKGQGFLASISLHHPLFPL